MNKRLLGLLLIVFACAASPSRADIDQLCLRNCVAANNPKAVCLSQCSYEATTEPSAIPHAAAPADKQAPTHNVLSTPVPLPPNQIVVGKPKPPASSKDYTCLSRCLKNGNAYGLCEQSCTKPDCPSGKVLCARPPSPNETPN